MLVAIITYRVFRKERKLAMKIVHASLLALSFIIAGVGLKAVWDHKAMDLEPEPHFFSLHSWLGLTTLILMGLQVSFNTKC